MTTTDSTRDTATRHHHRHRTHHGQSPDDPLLRAVDGGLAACIFVLPLIMGGRQALGGLVLSLLAVGVALIWLLRQVRSGQVTWRWCRLEWVFLAGVILLLVQCIPLPPSILRWLAPHTAEILPLWCSQDNSPVTMGTWSYISFTPSGTRAGLMTLVAYGLLFLITVQRIQRAEDVERLLGWCALSAVFMAAFGIVQLLTSNGKFFWFYQHPFSATDDVAKGSFTNRNHFADFLALGIGPLIWWIQNILRKQRHASSSRFRHSSDDSQLKDFLPIAGILALAVVVVACLLSLSRGGMAAMVLAVIIATLVCYRAGVLSPRLLLSLTGVALLVVAALAIFGQDRVSRRLSDMQTCSFEEIDHGAGRRTIWAAVVKAIPDFAVTGSGVGSLREVYPRYLDEPTGPDYYTHAENSPLQIALETGLPGSILLLVVIGFCGFWCLDGLRRVESKHVMVCLGAILAALLASLAHSMVDFNWYCPACMTLVVLLAACACRLWQLTVHPSESGHDALPMPRHPAMAMIVVLVAVGGWTLYDQFGSVVAERHWFQVRLMDLASDTQRTLAEESPETLSATSNVPNPVDSPFAPSEESLAAAVDAKNLTELEELIRWEPDHARAHLRLAAIYLHQFERAQQVCPNVMPLGQIREAVFAARNTPENPYSTRQALDQWMLRAFGEHCRYLNLALEHTHRALAVCPLLGEAYLYLGELCFLEGGTPEVKKAYLQQAMKLQPVDPNVLFVAGKDAFLEGNLEQGLEYLRASFHAGQAHQGEIIQLLTGRAPPEGRQAEIQAIIEMFQPDYQALKIIDRRYAQIALPEELIGLHRYVAQVAEAEAAQSDPGSERTALIWLTAHSMYDAVGDFPRARQCAQNAMGTAPNNYQVRCQLGLFYMRQQQFDEAERHFRWCLSRRPDDVNLQTRLKDVLKQKINQQTPIASPGTAPGMPVGIASRMPMGAAPGTPTGMPMGMPPGTPTGMPMGTPTATPMGMPAGVSPGVSSEMPQGTPTGVLR